MNYIQVFKKLFWIIMKIPIFDIWQLKIVQTFAQFWYKIVQNYYYWDIDSHHFQNRFRIPPLESSTRFPNPILDALLATPFFVTPKPN